MTPRDNLDFGFDTNRTIADAQMADWQASADIKRRADERRAALRAQGKARAATRSAAAEKDPGVAAQ